MTHLTFFTLAVALTLGAAPVLAGNGDLSQIRLQLRDQSCVDTATELLADQTMTMDQVRDRLGDCSCLLTDDDTVVTPQQIRLRTGADNGQGTLSRTRAESGGGRN